MEVHVNFVFFEELPDRLRTDGDVTRILVVREGKNPEAALEAASTDFFSLPLE